MQMSTICQRTVAIVAASLIGFTALAAGCSRNPSSPEPAAATSNAAAATAGVGPAASTAERPPVNPERNAYFGNVHVHTGYSFDAFTNGSKTTPQDAYDWAQGKAISGSGLGPEIKIVTPLDFYAVADHA